MDRRVASLLSIAMRGGFIKAGETAAEKALKDGSAKLVFTACDASENTRRKFAQKTFYYKTPYSAAFDKSELNRPVGLENAATLVLTDAGLADRIFEILEGRGIETYGQNKNLRFGEGNRS